jgi:hypothetical protein
LISAVAASDLACGRRERAGGLWAGRSWPPDRLRTHGQQPPPSMIVRCGLSTRGSDAHPGATARTCMCAGSGGTPGFWPPG